MFAGLLTSLLALGDGWRVCNALIIHNIEGAPLRYTPWRIIVIVTTVSTTAPTTAPTEPKCRMIPGMEERDVTSEITQTEETIPEEIVNGKETEEERDVTS